MPMLRFRPPTGRFMPVAAALALWLLPAPSRADFARPPESAYRMVDLDREGQDEARAVERVERWDDYANPERSTFRFQVGPALLLQPASPGLLTAVDIGRRAVGARVSASWLRAETDQGLAAYSAELWIDFRNRYQLHPILGAGASLLHGGALGEHDSAGAGVMRGALEYELPIGDADARLSLNLMALVPAIASERTRPWLIGGLMVGAGF